MTLRTAQISALEIATTAIHFLARMYRKDEAVQAALRSIADELSDRAKTLTAGRYLKLVEEFEGTPTTPGRRHRGGGKPH